MDVRFATNDSENSGVELFSRFQSIFDFHYWGGGINHSKIVALKNQKIFSLSLAIFRKLNLKNQRRKIFGLMARNAKWFSKQAAPHLHGPQQQEVAAGPVDIVECKKGRHPLVAKELRNREGTDQRGALGINQINQFINIFRLKIKYENSGPIGTHQNIVH